MCKQEVDDGCLAVFNTRLGVGGRYRCFPESAPTERRYFTVVFVRVATVTVQESNRMVSERNMGDVKKGESEYTV